MRILSLCCTNLNSLRGEQPEIRFDRGPLAAAGLFAITGPTGTGKTTLLDAITLALYGKVYRFEDEGAALSTEQIREQLMTIGTGRSEVEVTFRVDGLDYLAKWTCQRAHGKADGKMQEAQMWLSRIGPDGVIESPYKTRTEVPKEVARLTRLDFGQFVRSVLLPQGAFAQFLKAKKGGRAELLQKLTDTTRFADIGLAAHQRAQEAERLLEVADQRALLYAEQLLAPEVQERLQAEEAAARQALARFDTQLTELRTARQWFETDAQLRRAATDAATALTAAEAALARPETTELRTALDRHQQAEPCREAWDDWRRALQTVADLTGRHTDLSGRTAPLTAAVEAAKPAVMAAETSWQTAQQRRQTETPRLRQAELLDNQLASLDRQHRDQQTRIADATQHLTTQQQLLEKQQKTLADTRRQYQAATEWLTDNAADAALTPDALHAPRTAWQQAELAQQQLHQLAEQATADKRQADRLKNDLLGNAAKLQHARTAQEQATQHEAEALRELTTLLTHLLGHGAWLKSESEQATRTLDQLTRHHRRLEALHQLPAFRETVVDGEPCPLCGGLDHRPESVLTASDDELATSRQTLAAQQTTTDHLKARTDTLREAFVQARAAWPSDQALPLAAAPQCWFAAPAETALPTHITALHERLRAAAQARQTAQTDLAALTTAAQGCQEQQLELTRRAAARQTDRELAEARRDVEYAQVAAFFAPFEVAFAPATVTATLLALQRRGEAYQQKAQAQQTTRTTGTQLAEQVKTTAQAVADAQQRLTDEQAKAETLTTETTALRTQRLTLCPPDEVPATVLRALEVAENRALTHLETARETLRQAEKAFSDHQTAVALAQEQLTEATRKRDTCHETWHTQRAAHLLPDDTDLRTWLIADAAQLRTHRETLHRLETTHTTARDRREQAQTAAADHRLAGPDYAGTWAVEELLTELTAARDEQQRLIITNEMQLQQHQKAAAASLENVQALERQQAETDRWRELRKLIGGADLKSTRFSQFAQTLTLAHLVREANRHLTRLAPRYELLPRTDDDELGLWILDADHAGTARAVESLSGGETFLVSLALALGLSDLAGYRVQIESLFIDEGFGTLDPETLDTAISALETVQQSGRMVGVISHVAALKERIKTQIQLRKVAGGSRLAVVVEG